MNVSKAGGSRASASLAARIALVLAVVVLAESAALVWLWRTQGVTEVTMSPEARDAAQEEAIARLVEQGAGIYDSFTDPDVGRVLQPGLRQRQFANHTLVDSNRFGMREREVGLRKPPGAVRVAVLGDSFVFGRGVASKDRLSDQLEQLLRTGCANPAARPPAKLHSLAFGIGSWNILAEAAFLRRQLGPLRPDLVVHVVVGNDLGDNPGVRGFGAWSKYSDQVRGRGNGVLFDDYARAEFGTRLDSLLGMGLDQVSRSRFQAAGTAIGQLRDAVEAAGGAYLLVVRWPGASATARQYLGAELRDEQVIVLPRRFHRDRSMRVARGDPHWNAAGNLVVAQLVYAHCLQQELLSDLALRPLDADVADEVRSLREDGERESNGPSPASALERLAQVEASVEFPPEDDAPGVAQIYGGIRRNGDLAPYAALVLRRGGERLRVRVQPLGRGEVAGECVVRLEEEEVGRFALGGRSNAAVDLDIPLPAALLDRDFVSVEFLAGDYVYAEDDLQSCVCARLVRVAIE